MNFSRFFVDRPIFAAVVSIIIFAIGLISIPNLPVSEYPEVVPPSVVVRTVYPGANPKEIAETVATPLEEAVSGVEDMMYYKSVAGSDGVLQMTVTFRPGTDAEAATVRVQNRGKPGSGPATGGSPAPGCDYPETVPYLPDGGAPDFSRCCV